MTNGELRRVLLLGPPGAGKGTLAPHLSELLGVPHVSSGRLLRASAAEGDPHRIAEQVVRGREASARSARRNTSSTSPEALTRRTRPT